MAVELEHAVDRLQAREGPVDDILRHALAHGLALDALQPGRPGILRQRRGRKHQRARTDHECPTVDRRHAVLPCCAVILSTPGPIEAALARSRPMAHHLLVGASLAGIAVGARGAAYVGAADRPILARAHLRSLPGAHRALAAGCRWRVLRRAGAEGQQRDAAAADRPMNFMIRSSSSGARLEAYHGGEWAAMDVLACCHSERREESRHLP